MGSSWIQLKEMGIMNHLDKFKNDIFNITAISSQQFISWKPSDAL